MKQYKLTEPLKYDGNSLTVDETIERWNVNKPQNFHQDRTNFIRNMKNYANKNKLLKLNTDQINICLITKDEKYGGYFDGNFYSGVKCLYYFLKSSIHDIVSLPRFRQALKSINGDETVWRDLQKDEVIKLASYKSTLAVDGNRGSVLNAFYKEIPEPKRKWFAIKKHIENYRREHGEEPNRNWLLSIAKPKDRFINDISDYHLLPKDEFQPGINELHQRLLVHFQDICSLAAFGNRIRRTEKSLTPLPLSYIIILAYPSTYLLLDGHLRITLYSITCFVDGKTYIGITSRCLEDRKKDHQRQAKEGSQPEGGLHEAIATHGIQNFTELKVLGIFSTIQEARDAEIEEIKKQNTRKPNGLNLTSG